MRTLDASSVIWAFAPDLLPAYMVSSGETVLVLTRDALDGLVQPGMVDKPRIERANPATGPIAVQGLRPGQTLAVDILDIALPAAGFLTCGERPCFFEFRQGQTLFADGIRLRTEPMIGTIGLAPGEGAISASLPGDHGGNMDTRDIAAGATLYLHARVPGGLLALGDVHALQADGESSGQGIETAAAVTLRLRVLDAAPSPRPYLVRAGVLMTIASAPTLDEAARQANEDMKRILVDYALLSSAEAKMLLGLLADVRVSQMVNPLKTARVALPLTALPWRRCLPL